MDELKQTRISLGIHAPAAVAAGWISYALNDWLAGVSGLALLIGCGFLSERLTKKKGMKWWLANGLFIYLMFWLISWTLFANVWA